MPELFSHGGGGIDVEACAVERRGDAAVGDSGEEEVAEHPLKGSGGVSGGSLVDGVERVEGGNGEREGKAEGGWSRGGRGGGVIMKWVKRPKRTTQWY